MSSFLGRVARLAAALGIPDEGGATAVLRLAAAAMGEQPKADMAMPDVLAMLELAVGIADVDADAPSPPTAAPATAAPAAAAGSSNAATPSNTAAGPAPSNKAAGKQKASSSSSSSSTGTLRAFFPTKVVSKVLLDRAAARLDGAVPFEEVEEQAAMTLDKDSKLPSELAARVAAPKASWFCEQCPRAFETALALRNHSKWCTGTASRRRIDEPIQPKPFDGDVTCTLAVASDGGASCQLFINGKGREQILTEAEEQRAAHAKAKAEREAEQDRRKHERQRQRDAAVSEQRRGAERRIQHSAKEKLQVLDWYDKAKAEGPAGGKGAYFEDDHRSRGLDFRHVGKWAKPAARRDIQRAAAQEHAASLMRIDKQSRRKGKFALMERILFSKFKVRRTRGRKCSPKWFPHTARHIMRTEFPEHAAGFKGSRGWMRRFFKRFSIVRRKRTNNKNTTWEEAKPKLQRYFRAFRRRLRDTEWRRARETAVAAARARQPAAAAAAPTAAAATPVAEEPDGVEGDALRERMRERVDAAMAAEEEAAAVAAEPNVPWWNRGHAKWGKYLPHQRFNKDQVSSPPEAPTAAPPPRRRRTRRRPPSLSRRSRFPSSSTWTTHTRRRAQSASPSTSSALRSPSGSALQRSSFARSHRRRRPPTRRPRSRRSTRPI